MKRIWEKRRKSGEKKKIRPSPDMAPAMVTERIDTEKEAGEFHVILSQVMTHTKETICAVLIGLGCARVLTLESRAAEAELSVRQFTSISDPVSVEGAYPKADSPAVVSAAYVGEGARVLWYVSGVQEPVSAMSAVIGNTVCQIPDSGAVSDNPRASLQTVILVDNSVSISEENRSRIRQMITRLLALHEENEYFAIYTYSTTLTLLAEGTDYEQMQAQTVDLSFSNQDSWPVSALYEVLSQMAGSAACRRIIFVSDGADDSTLGISYSELKDLLADDTFRCQIFTVIADWEKNRSGQREMAALSRLTNARSWQLADYTDGGQIALEIDRCARPYYFLFQIPVEEKDGRHKQLTLYLETGTGSETLSAQVSTPLRTESEHQAMIQALQEKARETEAQTQEQTKEAVQRKEETEPEEWTRASESAQTEGAVSEEETRQARREEPEAAHRRRITGPLLLLAGIALAGGMAGIAWWVLSGRRQSGRAQGEPEEPSGPVLSMSLEDMADPGKRRILPANQETVLGRRAALCDIAFPEDQTVSGRHAKLSLSGEEAWLEDLGSVNGTFLNGSAVSERIRLHDGDIIRIGRTSLRFRKHRHRE